MRKRMVTVLVLVGLCAGCTTAAKQAFYTATGPQGAFLLLSSAEENALGKYECLEVACFDNDLSRVVDGNLPALVQSEIVGELREKNVFSQVKPVPSFQQGKGDVRTVVMRGRLIDITSDKIPGQKLIGSSNHLIAVVELVDKENSKVLARANLRGVVKSVAETGEKPLAEGMARGAKKLCEELGKREKR